MAIAVSVVLILVIGTYEQTFGCGLPAGCADQTPTPIAVGQRAEGRLSGLHPQRFFSLDIAAGGPVTVDVEADFDSFVELQRQGGTFPLAMDDDGGEGLNARLTVALEPGSYTILVRGAHAAARGPFTLAISRGQALTPTGPASPGLSGQPAPAPLPSIQPQMLQGIVASVTGPAPVPNGAACAVTIAPATGQFNCRVRISCGPQRALLYGANNAGFNLCGGGPAGSLAIVANDQGLTAVDGDPRMSINTATQTVIISDQMGPTTWVVEIRLASPNVEGAPFTATK